ncbi:MAG: LysR family transcriptional regulator [Lactobacillus sp.]|jgi:DNA-binding transcriptional LysR family regulator|uniref:LysR substrate-binding domain-containing protein n=1 Tax=Lacticaseibacillus suilingensis TaxID=2799577 RepID=A0ABW4BGD2_9LACO|nr:LysR family transcriptional regulator [Lacticaseibacillus suilingensis]MCI1893314.1 LysR family transcriptional regulator [Lactobacillus sp.]MCI1918366.1 LysR family transcriptional regulator [Lactobacillus sp.]MCI1940499.1 LysR family transcriptional regulator [Lactobacillus sp.]MCI1971096.1 LysR family transcriptional regulator [Lactobacillus sp.]MCI2038301.1 LysR family transcriptional regulator [Lactobacillus sp.]
MKTKQDSIFSSKTLSYFLQLAETMNYTQAAQLLGITQPALTQQIKKLERAVGAPLFYSVGKKLHLSDAGRTMLAATHDIYDTLNQATDEIQQASNANSGTIKIGLLASIEDSAFTGFISDYYLKNQDVEVVFLNMTRHEIWEHLENNQIDLAVMYLPDDTIKNWKPYESRKIVDEQLLFLHHSDKLANRKRVHFRDTVAQPWVTYPENYFLSHFLKEAYKNQMVDYPEVVAQFTTPYQITQFLNRTGVNTALPNSFYQAHQEQIHAHAVAFEPAVSFELAFVFRKGKDQIPRISQFLSAFDTYLSEEDYLSRVADNRVKLNE